MHDFLGRVFHTISRPGVGAVGIGVHASLVSAASSSSF